MARTTYIQDPVTNKLIPKNEYYLSVDVNAPMIMGDIQPYKSMVTGEMIMGRAQHKAHLKQHRLIEIGNETKYLKNTHKEMSDMKQHIAREVYNRLK